MQLTIQMKLLPDAMQARLIEETMTGYIGAVNSLVSEFVAIGMLVKRSSANVNAALPSALRGQAVQDARSVFRKYAKDLKSVAKANLKRPPEEQNTAKIPVLKKPVAIWNNQNYSIGEDTISKTNEARSG